MTGLLHVYKLLTQVHKLLTHVHKLLPHVHKLLRHVHKLLQHVHKLQSHVHKLQVLKMLWQLHLLQQLQAYSLNDAASSNKKKMLSASLSRLWVQLS